MNSTAFHIMADKERENGYLVTHTNESRKYAWNQHSFKVIANVEAGIFECECHTWEHTDGISPCTIGLCGPLHGGYQDIILD
jgi:hypothetical protein